MLYQAEAVIEISECVLEILCPYFKKGNWFKVVPLLESQP